MPPTARALGQVAVQGNRKQLAETALALHRAGKKVTVISQHGEKTEFNDYHEYEIHHRDTHTVIYKDNHRDSVALHVDFDGTKHLKVTGGVIDL